MKFAAAGRVDQTDTSVWRRCNGHYCLHLLPWLVTLINRMLGLPRSVATR
jgi:hypothetical protein